MAWRDLRWGCFGPHRPLLVGPVRSLAVLSLLMHERCADLDLHRDAPRAYDCRVQALVPGRLWHSYVVVFLARHAAPQAVDDWKDLVADLNGFPLRGTLVVVDDHT